MPLQPASNPTAAAAAAPASTSDTPVGEESTSANVQQNKSSWSQSAAPKISSHLFIESKAWSHKSLQNDTKESSKHSAEPQKNSEHEGKLSELSARPASATNQGDSSTGGPNDNSSNSTFSNQMMGGNMNPNMMNGFGGSSWNNAFNPMMAMQNGMQNWPNGMQNMIGMRSSYLNRNSLNPRLNPSNTPSSPFMKSPLIPRSGISGMGMNPMMMSPAMFNSFNGQGMGMSGMDSTNFNNMNEGFNGDWNGSSGMNMRDSNRGFAGGLASGGYSQRGQNENFNQMRRGGSQGFNYRGGRSRGRGYDRGYDQPGYRRGRAGRQPFGENRFSHGYRDNANAPYRPNFRDRFGAADVAASEDRPHNETDALSSQNEVVTSPVKRQIEENAQAQAQAQGDDVARSENHLAGPEPNVSLVGPDGEARGNILTADEGKTPGENADPSTVVFHDEAAAENACAEPSMSLDVDGSSPSTMIDVPTPEQKDDFEQKIPTGPAALRARSSPAKVRSWELKTSPVDSSGLADFSKLSLYTEAREPRTKQSDQGPTVTGAPLGPKAMLERRAVRARASLQIGTRGGQGGSLAPISAPPGPAADRNAARYACSVCF